MVVRLETTKVVLTAERVDVADVEEDMADFQSYLQLSKSVWTKSLIQ